MAKHQFELAGDAEHYPISIEVFGFLKGASLSPIEVAKLLQLLPSHNISGLRKIVYKRALSKPLNRWFSRTSKARLSGLYSPADHQITLYGGSTREGLAHTLFHEVAHHVYFRVLDSSEKKTLGDGGISQRKSSLYLWQKKCRRRFCRSLRNVCDESRAVAAV